MKPRHSLQADTYQDSVPRASQGYPSVRYRIELATTTQTVPLLASHDQAAVLVTRAMRDLRDQLVVVRLLGPCLEQAFQVRERPWDCGQEVL